MFKNIVTFTNAKLRRDEEGTFYLDLEILIDHPSQSVIMIYSIRAGHDATARMDESTRRMLGDL